MRTKRRDECVLATKVAKLRGGGGPPQSETFPDAPPLNPVFDFSYDGVMRSVEESVSRLGIERIDILHIHDPDDHFAEPLSEAYPALHPLRAEGTITAGGARVDHGGRLAR